MNEKLYLEDEENLGLQVDETMSKFTANLIH